MATNYPTALDNLTNPVSNDSLNSPSHSAQHANANDAIEAIEAKLGVGNANQVGLYHITTATITGASSVSIDNCFSATYDSYRIICTAKSTGSTSDVTMKLRASGVDNIATPWANWNAVLAWGASPTWILGGANGAVSGTVGTISTLESSFVLDFHHPYSAKIKTYQGSSSRTDGYGGFHNGYMNSTALWDGFTLALPTCTGQVRVFGYRNSTA
jgi:hypothetical protein